MLPSGRRTERHKSAVYVSPGFTATAARQRTDRTLYANADDTVGAVVTPGAAPANVGWGGSFRCCSLIGTGAALAVRLPLTLALRGQKFAKIRRWFQIEQAPPVGREIGVAERLDFLHGVGQP